MTKKKILLRIVLPFVIVALFVGGLVALGQYWKPFIRTSEFTVCNANGETKTVQFEVAFHRWVFAPTSVRATATIDGVFYGSFDTRFGFPGNSEWEKPTTEGFFDGLEQKQTENRTSVLFTSQPLFLNGDPFSDDSDTVLLCAIAIDDDFQITAAWMKISDETFFGPAGTSEEAEPLNRMFAAAFAPDGEIIE